MKAIVATALVSQLLCLSLVACRRTDREAMPAQGAAASQLVGVEWNLVELNGRPAPRGAGEKPATLTLSDADQRANGFAGCNRFTGSYELRGEELKFGPLAMTRMACETGMDLEQQYAAALAATRRYRLAGQDLALLDDQGVIARFTSAS